MAGGVRKQAAASLEIAPGWRNDEPLDLTPGEHGVMAAVLELAWHDVQIDLDAVPPVRREEALAAKLTAYEWIRSDDDFLMSFRSVCLHLGIENVERAREVILRGVDIPEGASVPPRWLEEYASTSRRDREYVKRQVKPSPCPELLPPAVSSASSEPVPVLPSGEASGRVEPTVVDESSAEPLCAELDEVPEEPSYSLAELIAEINVPSEPAAGGADPADNWADAVAESEDPEAGD